ncbi:MAG: HgcAB-associated protein [bacterium]
MAKKEKRTKADVCCTPEDVVTGSCCRVESLLSVDERGQMVLPKSLRDRAGISAGDKLGLVTWEKEGKICCIVLIKADEMAVMAKNMISPLMRDI